MNHLIVKTRIHCFEDCTSIIPNKIDFINKWISKNELMLSVLGTLPMLRYQIKCPRCSRLIRKEYHEENPSRHNWKIRYKYNRISRQSESYWVCSCGTKGQWKQN